MGCDITIVVEYRDGADDNWKRIDIANPYARKRDDGRPVYLTPYDGRNYALFGILAGVRSNELKQIDDIRGLPMDCDPKTREEYETPDYGYFGASYYTLEELLLWAKDKSNFYIMSPEEMEYYDIEPKDREEMECFSDMARSSLYRLIYGAETLASAVEEQYLLSRDVRIVFWFDN